MLAVIAVALLAFTRSGDARIEYRIAQVTLGDIESTATALGKIRPKDYVDVGAQVSGQLERVLVEVGEQVEKGQLLAEIDATVLRAKVDAGRAQLKELEANVAEQRAEVKLARAKAERNRRLRASDAVSEDEAQTSQAQLDVAIARAAGIEAQIERVRSTLEGDLANLSYTQIFAPMSGTVVSQSALAGQTLNANQTTPTILQIADLTRMTVSADVSEADVTRLAPGMPVYFSTLGTPERRWSTTLRQVLPQPEIVNDVVLYKALLDIENADRALLPEMTAQVFFQLGEARNALVVPLAALRDPISATGSRARRSGGTAQEPRRAGAARTALDAQSSEPADPAKTGGDAAGAVPSGAQHKSVLVLRNGEPEPRAVLVGLQNRTSAQILSGLEPGETIVVGTLEQNDDSERGADANRMRGLRRML